MNSLSPHYYFIADLHLNDHQPQITAHFLQFLRDNAPLAEAVYILGDLFDFWVGDDEQSELIAQVKQQLKQLTTSDVKCYFICGNRDFLIGNRFAEETGITLLPDYYPIDLFGKKTLLCHGDTLCIDDVKYQRFRRKVHQKWRQRLFLCLPLKWRVSIAEKIRAKSRADKRQKSAEIMDVNPAFTAQTVAKYQAEWLIHGHTHRQAVHYGRKSADSLFTRIVLGDWGEQKISILSVTADGFRFIENLEKSK
ncbi:UDP-2,3-diacylglucosamine hydrolase [[Actinobacillus] muris]|uniref:UDP-2,3-diacylglucosamine hydrolase n=1 Tax=Muribacter muris TaxID=67855 RepID=A0A0J5P6M6_9PAST|nr:UDP-2,3-diacylglucosamine diphosphatase [Muribacter muris]KMK51124.1 UDP-2,3-diacylglucosamine hydrolase [[Actinobacillus] muris] [Muribacter muris]